MDAKNPSRLRIFTTARQFHQYGWAMFSLLSSLYHILEKKSQNQKITNGINWWPVPQQYRSYKMEGSIVWYNWKNRGEYFLINLYKLFKDNFLVTLKYADLGSEDWNEFHDLCDVTNLHRWQTANDKPLITDEAHALQAMVTVCNNHSDDNIYQLHPVKSVVPIHIQVPVKAKPHSWFMGDKGVVTSFIFWMFILKTSTTFYYNASKE